MATKELEALIITVKIDKKLIGLSKNPKAYVLCEAIHSVIEMVGKMEFEEA